MIATLPARRQTPQMASARLGHHQNRLAVQTCPAAQVQVLAVEGHGVVETAEPVERLGPDKHAGTGYGKHLGDPIVLPLVVFAGGDQRHRNPHPVRRETHTLQEPGVVPIHELRACHGGLPAHRFVDQARHRIRSRRHVVVTDQQEGGVVRLGGLAGDVRRGPLRRVRVVDPILAREHASGRIDRGTETGIARHDHDGGVGHHRRHPGGHVRDGALGGPALARDVHHRNRHRGVVLVPQRPQGLVEPVPGIVGDHDGANRWADPAEALGWHSGGVRGFH